MSKLWSYVSTIAFIVSEANAHGMQVFDLTRLRNVTNPPETFTADAHYTGFGNAHNIVIDQDAGFAYVVGTARDDAFQGGAHFLNIQDPKNPVAVGGYAENGYSHDAQGVKSTLVLIENRYTAIRYNNGDNRGKTQLISYICKLFRINPVNYDTSI